MGTKKPFSGISYNSVPFLVDRLQNAYCNGLISFWAFIFHKGERKDLNDPNSPREKDHIHCFVVPAKSVEPEVFRRSFEEFDPNHSKPLGWMPNLPASKPEDWYLYGVHDKEYLEKKGEVKEFHYTDDCIICSDVNYMQSIIASAREQGCCSVEKKLRECAREGLAFPLVVARGYIPLKDVYRYERAYHDLLIGFHHRDYKPVEVSGPVDNCPYTILDMEKEFPCISKFKNEVVEE